MGACPGLHRVTRAAVRASGSLETHSSSGPPCASDKGTCWISFTSDGREREPPWRPCPCHSGDSLDTSICRYPAYGIAQVGQGGVGGPDGLICRLERVILQHVQLPYESISVSGLSDIHQKRGKRSPA